jgi:RNA polymerase sigma-70 factor, ECF subfamily
MGGDITSPVMHRNDIDAFEDLFRTYHSRLCGFAYTYLNDRDAARDVVQDLFMAIWQKRETMEIRTSVRAYLFAALRNRLLNKSARAKLEQQWFQRADIGDTEIADETLAIDQQMQSAETGARVRQAVAALPPGCRSVVQLRFQEEMSYQEIAESLGIAPKTVENQLARARKLLRQALPDVID